MGRNKKSRKPYRRQSHRRGNQALLMSVPPRLLFDVLATHMADLESAASLGQLPANANAIWALSGVLARMVDIARETDPASPDAAPLLHVALQLDAGCPVDVQEVRAYRERVEELRQSLSRYPAARMQDLLSEAISAIAQEGAPQEAETISKPFALPAL